MIVLTHLCRPSAVVSATFRYRRLLVLALVSSACLAIPGVTGARDAARHSQNRLTGLDAGSAPAQPLLFATNGDGLHGTLELATITPDGTGFRKLTRHDGPARAFDPRWTTDGESIVFNAYDEFTDLDTTWRMRPDGSGLRLLPGDKWYPPSPSGESVHVWDRIVDVNGKTIRTLRLVRLGPDDLGGSPPLWSPDGRYLALNMYTETQRELYTWIMVVPTDGRGRARVVTPRRDGHYAHAASWSPDSRRLLVRGEDARERDIWYTIARDGSDRRRLRPRWSGDHAWSPDSSTIAYVQSRAIMGVPARGGAVRRIVRIRSRARQTQDVALDWSARGELAFSDVGGIFVARPDSNRVRRVTTLRGAPDWSPDGDRVVFAHDGEIVVVDRRGRGLHRLTDWSWDDAPQWSPDGKRIAFVRGSSFYATGGSAGERTQVYIASSNGTRQRRIGRGSEPRWSPNGHTLAFVRAITPDIGPPRHRVVVEDVDRAGRVEIAGLDPAWSPDGERLALLRHTYDEARENDWVAYASTLLVVRRDGSDLRELVAADDWLLFDPQWSPDGRTIAASALKTDYKKRFQLVDVDTGAVRELRSSLPDRYAWSPDGRDILFTECERWNRAVLAVLDLESGSTRIVAKATGAEWCPDYESFAWSPDGSRIGYIRCTPFDVEPKSCDVHVMHTDGSHSRRLTSTLGIERSLDW